MPKKYDVEFKARAVRLVRDHLDDYGSVTAASVAVGAVMRRHRGRRVLGVEDRVGDELLDVLVGDANDAVLAAAREGVRGVRVTAGGCLGRASGAGVSRAVTHDRGHDRDAPARRGAPVGLAPDLRRIFVVPRRDTRTVARG